MLGVPQKFSTWLDSAAKYVSNCNIHCLVDNLMLYIFVNDFFVDD